MGTVLVVDDIAGNARLLESLLAPDGHTVRTAGDGAAALRLVRAEHPDLVLMDVMMPHFDGFEACLEIKQDPTTRLIPVVLVTSLNDTASRIRGIDVGADDFISKPFNPHELRARIRSLLRLKRYTDDLDSAESVIVSLALTIEARDSMTAGHCQRLAQYASALGRTLGLDEDDVSALERGGFLHDVGKVGIPDAVLLKPGPLTREEYELIKQHTVIGDRLCGQLRFLRNVRPIVRHHHERLDGSGYPDQLRGDAIPLLAQIMGIVDVFDALTTDRPYKAALPFARAVEELQREAARGWRRADLVATFLNQVDQLDRAERAAGLVAEAVSAGRRGPVDAGDY
jgi:cyclic di-GMP phosphodiesterase